MIGRPARWWRREGERVVCELCPRACRLRPGQRGFCAVRAADADGLVLSAWGRASGLCVDPIEKKPLHHFLPGTPVLSFGTIGCNLGCRFCQNWHVSKAKAEDPGGEEAGPEAIAAAARSLGARSVAFTYNDPVIFAEYAIDVAAACHALGVRTVAVTAGYVSPGPREALFGAMDAANVDLKAFTEAFYRRLCLGHLEPVKETLVWLARERRTWLELTTLLIPDENDGDAELHALCAWVRDALGPEVPIHFTAYHPDFQLARPRTPPATLNRARAIAAAEGLRFAYTGNVVDPEGASTWCPGCGALLVGRRGYELFHWGLDGGACRACGRAIPGVFEAVLGRWGGRRQAVRL